LTFRRLCDAAASQEADAAVRILFEDAASYDHWAVRWRIRVALEPTDGVAIRAAMLGENPAVIPRNHRVEAAIDAAVTRRDFAAFDDLMTALSKPYEDRSAFSKYSDPPPPNQRVYQGPEPMSKVDPTPAGAPLDFLR
jgi:uncharacterized protein YdiU (UPF0061 family)